MYTFCGGVLAQTINNSGFCNIINQGDNNRGYYIQYCNADGSPKIEVLDPPYLWIGMPLQDVKKMIGARSPVEDANNGRTVLLAHGTLFGLPGKSRYGFNAEDKLAWMSIENQCTETRDDYTLTQQPPGLSPDWLEWRHSFDDRLSYEATTQCSKIEGVPATLAKLFGAPVEENSALGDSGPREDEICRGIEARPPYCTDTGARRDTFSKRFRTPDGLIEIGTEIRMVTMHGVVKKGDYYPTVRRQELVGTVSVWGPDGKPTINPDVYGHFRSYLEK